MDLIHEAARCGDLVTVRGCLYAGRDVNGRDIYNKTPLHNLMTCLKHPSTIIKILHLLVKNGADVNALDGSGNSALFLAVRDDKPTVILKELVKLGAQWKNARNSFGYSILEYVVFEANVESLWYFISLGANVKEKDRRGRTLLHTAASRKMADDKFLMVATNLVGCGVGVNDVDINGDSMLFVATMMGYGKPVFELLLRLGADWKVTNNVGEGILKMAVRGGNFVAYDFFLSKGADPMAMGIYPYMTEHHISFLEEVERRKQVLIDEAIRGNEQTQTNRGISQVVAGFKNFVNSFKLD